MKMKIMVFMRCCVVCKMCSTKVLEEPQGWRQQVSPKHHTQKAVISIMTWFFHPQMAYTECFKRNYAVILKILYYCKNLKLSQPKCKVHPLSSFLFPNAPCCIIKDFCSCSSVTPAMTDDKFHCTVSFETLCIYQKQNYFTSFLTLYIERRKFW
jgi:hypothetical protein